MSVCLRFWMFLMSDDCQVSVIAHSVFCCDRCFREMSTDPDQMMLKWDEIFQMQHSVIFLIVYWFCSNVASIHMKPNCGICVLQEGYWELTTELGEYVNVDVDSFVNMFLKNKGICSLGENKPVFKSVWMGLWTETSVPQSCKCTRVRCASKSCWSDDCIKLQRKLQLHFDCSGWNLFPFYEDVHAALHKWENYSTHENVKCMAATASGCSLQVRLSVRPSHSWEHDISLKPWGKILVKGQAHSGLFWI